MIKDIRHTGIVVRDLAKMTDFYKSLGFVEINRDIEQGNFIDTVTGIKHVKLEWIKLRLPDYSILELLKYHSHQEKADLKKQKSNKLGCSHIAFSVDNIEDVCGEIIKLGGSLVNLPILTNDKKVKVAYCHDSEGNLMEIVEVF
jgi:catechol 2,3-dioxygenase-like lactoylglutathione lyase family enzyme